MVEFGEGCSCEWYCIRVSSTWLTLYVHFVSSFWCPSSVVQTHHVQFIHICRPFPSIPVESHDQSQTVKTQKLRLKKNTDRNLECNAKDVLLSNVVFKQRWCCDCSSRSRRPGRAGAGRCEEHRNSHSRQGRRRSGPGRTRGTRCWSGCGWAGRACTPASSRPTRGCPCGTGGR